MINPSLTPILSSDVTSYDGNSLGVIPLGVSPSLNEALEAIGTYVSALSPTTTLDSDNITLAVNCTGTGSIIGDTLSTFFSDLTTTLAAIDLTPYLLKSTYDAHTILYATADNTPLALTVGASTFVGRKSSGGISAMSVAEVITELATVNKDANSVFPYSTALPFSVGAETAVNKTLLVVKESAVWADNPYLAWGHDLVMSTEEGLVVVGRTTKDTYYKVIGKTGSSGLYCKSDGATAATKNQDIILGYQVSSIDPFYHWYLRADGGDSNYFKIGYYNGAVENEYLQINKTTGRFTLNATTEIIGVLDEDAMGSDSAVHVPTQQSVKAYVDNNTASQTEMNTTQTGAGLNADGTYTADPASSYITGATSLKDADSLLDDEIKLINDRLVSATVTAEKIVKCAYGTFTWSQQATTGVFSINLATNIPDNSIITYARVDVTTVFTDNDANTSTIGLGIENVGAGTEDIKNAAAIGTDFTLGLKADTWSDYLPATPFKLTAARDITVNVVLGGAATTLSTGELSIYVEYFTTK